jgi:MFS family permease
LNWIISSFTLTSAAFLFFWAQMADIFGRHVTVQAAIIVMLIGSAVSTGAPTSSFSVLLLGRAIQGIGCSGVNISVRIILADRVSLSEFASNWTVFVLVSGVSFGLGPLIGGYLTQASWRWCFAINLPIALASIFLVAILLRKELVGPQPLPELVEAAESNRRGRVFARLGTIDVGGQMLFLWGLGLLLLALTWGGSTYSWSSAAVLAPLVIGSVMAVAWAIYERSLSPGQTMSRVFPRHRAMMPWDVLSQRDNLLIFLINFGGGMAMFAVIYFSDLYFTLVEMKSSSEAGLALLFYMPGLSGKQLNGKMQSRGANKGCSRCFHGNLFHKRMASPDLAAPRAWEHDDSSGNDGPGLGNQGTGFQCHLRHDGAHRPRYRAPDEPCILALPRVLP